MSAGLFRAPALEALSTPEQLDQTLRITGPLSWVALAVLGLCLAATGAWSVATRVPLKVHGQGIFVSPSGVLGLAVTASSDGRLGRLLVRRGEAVRAGQPVAEIEQRQLDQRLRVARSEHADLLGRRRQVSAFQAREAGALAQRHDRRRRVVLDNVQHLEQRLAWLQEREDDEHRLLEKGYVQRQRLLDTRVELATVKQKIAEARSELQGLDSARGELQVRHERELLDLELAIASAARAVASLEETLARQGRVLSPYTGTVSEVSVNAGEVVRYGETLFSVLPDQDVPAAAPALLGVLYVPAGDGKKVQPGMEVLVEPSTARREEHGLMRARVEQVARVATSTEGMARVLGNDQLVRGLAEGGAAIEVQLTLEPDPGTPSGWAWTSSRGPDLPVTAGTLFKAEINLRRVRLITLLIPALERLFPAETGP